MLAAETRQMAGESPVRQKQQRKPVADTLALATVRFPQSSLLWKIAAWFFPVSRCAAMTEERKAKKRKGTRYLVACRVQAVPTTTVEASEGNRHLGVPHAGMTTLVFACLRMTMIRYQSY